MGNKSTLIAPDQSYHSAFTSLGLHVVKRAPKLNDYQTLRRAESRLPHRLWATFLAFLGTVSLRCLCATGLYFPLHSGFCYHVTMVKTLKAGRTGVTRVLGRKWSTIYQSVFLVRTPDPTT